MFTRGYYFIFLILQSRFQMTHIIRSRIWMKRKNCLLITILTNCLYQVKKNGILVLSFFRIVVYIAM